MPHPSKTPPAALVQAARRHVLWGSAAVCALALAAPASAMAAAATAQADQSLEEVVVTAQRRDTKLLSTPIAVNAVTAQALREGNVRRLNDLAGFAAGVNIPNQTLANQSIFIRGVGTAIASANPSVGVYIDDIYVPRPFGVGWYGSLPDIQQIEILHGPQGTLYGQSSSAGALKINSTTPTDQGKAWIEAGVGDQKSYEARGYLAGGIVPGKLAGSLAAAYVTRGGPDYNAYLKRDVGKVDNLQVRGILSYTPRADFDARLAIDYMRDRGEYRTAAPLNRAGGGLRTTFSDTDPSQPYDGAGGALRLTWRANDVLTLRSITGVRGFNTTTPVDSDGLPTFISGFVRKVDQRQYSQEFQLLAHWSKVDVTSGLVLYQEDLDTSRLSWNQNVFSYIDSTNTAKNAGLYTQVDYALTDKLKLTAGVRFSYERREMDSAAFRSNVSGALLGTIYNLNGLKADYQSAIPRVSLAYQWTPNILSYVSVGTGQTTGGFNQAAPTAAVAAISVDPEKVTAYEFGNKASLFDGRLSATATVFYNDYRDYQASLANPVLNGVLTAGTIVVNAGDASIYGAEFELSGRPVEHLTTRLSISLLHSEFDSFLNPSGAANTNYVGQALPFAPEFTAAAGATYAHPFANGGEARVTGSVRYEDSSYSEITTVRNLTEFPPQTYVDASVAYTAPGGKWTVSVSAKNLFDTDYRLPVAGAYSPAGGFFGFISDYPRQVVARVRHDF